MCRHECVRAECKYTRKRGSGWLLLTRPCLAFSWEGGCCPSVSLLDSACSNLLARMMQSTIFLHPAEYRYGSDRYSVARNRYAPTPGGLKAFVLAVRRATDRFLVPPQHLSAPQCMYPSCHARSTTRGRARAPSVTPCMRFIHTHACLECGHHAWVAPALPWMHACIRQVRLCHCAPLAPRHYHHSSKGKRRPRAAPGNNAQPNLYTHKSSRSQIE